MQGLNGTARWIVIMLVSLAIIAIMMRCEKDTASYPFIEPPADSVTSMGLAGEPCENNYLEWDEHHLERELLKMLQVLNRKAIPLGYVYYIVQDLEGLYHLKKREHGFELTDSTAGPDSGQLRSEHRGLSQPR